MSQRIKRALLDSVAALRASAEAIEDESGAQFIISRLQDVADDLEGTAEEVGKRR